MSAIPNNVIVNIITKIIKQHGLPAIKIIVEELLKRKGEKPIIILGRILARIATEILSRKRLPSA
ncbi:MAG: hypothetical protein IKZ07_01165 [Akkermansia sp.]|nr:hypothetical protein [Akkermansia sp.]